MRQVPGRSDMTVILGVDAGTTGALALIDDDGIIDVADMPTADNVVSPVLIEAWLADWAPQSDDIALAVVERLHAMPPPIGSKANFSKGHSYGVVLGVLAARHVPLEMPTPSNWKREMGVTKDKDSSRALALNLWPGDHGLFTRKKDADRAEAALLAEWGRRLLVERGQAA